ncbi:MAG: hypothetical protein ABSA79_07735 [Candidatus Bathyarchaeia archaeon]|jgi:hypothetical protein
MPITIAEFRKLPERQFSPIAEYLHKRFHNKQEFLNFITEKTGLKVVNKGYEPIIHEICSKIGKDHLLSVLGLSSEREAELRVFLYDALYYGLTEAFWAHQLGPLYERIVGKKVKITRKIDKRSPAYTIAFSSNEQIFSEAWIELFKEEILPYTLHYEKITLGALGWLKSPYQRKTEQYSPAFDIIANRFKKKHHIVILNSLINLIAKDSEEKNLPQEFDNQLKINLNAVANEKNAELRSIKSLQLIETYLNDDIICDVINCLIVEGYVEAPEVQRFYECFPYSFSDWIITPYGIFKKLSDWLRTPSKELADLVERKSDPKYLEPDLEKYQGTYSLRVLGYCIRETPEKILRNFGVINLRNIAEELGIRAALKISNETELVQLIILKLGFNLPPLLTGLAEFDRLLDECISRLHKYEEISSVMSDAYGEMERVLQDLSYFYIVVLWKVRTRERKPSEVEAEINHIVHTLEVGKPFFKLTFGERIKLMRILTEKIHKDTELKNEYVKIFSRDNFVSRDIFNLLDLVSPWRSSSFAHTKSVNGKKPTRQACFDIIFKLKKISKLIEEEKLYPALIRVTQEVTNEYGTRYFEAIDNKGNDWIIVYSGLNPSKPYFMYSKTTPVAVEPVIVEKIF